MPSKELPGVLISLRKSAVEAVDEQLSSDDLKPIQQQLNASTYARAKVEHTGWAAPPGYMVRPPFDTPP